ncbi:hypothetical protein B4096_3704 [Heyndrickxia coagulans]|uniref:Uncharacterized protein n=1 Tax=Heyndrickxia coagulans TaxID=1398 RepID=A0A150JPG7_HEYCO|nr:hypothetical protein HMPREF3213_03947 [Heyndrickxia coagulans]KYC59129.1 hypothetical protein B4100_3630 [Heyndrickxia coagulans]KYC89762.1 hypothetical protein B4096_3704 [Heyndrickxia coagulans]
MLQNAGNRRHPKTVARLAVLNRTKSAQTTGVAEDIADCKQYTDATTGKMPQSGIVRTYTNAEK